MIYLLMIWNLFTFLIMEIDKWKSIHQRYRISECFLLACGFFLGSIGIALGMIVFHHKTRKTKFKILIPIFVILHILIYLRLVV